ncbi:MAG: type II toxin-antitoxin system YafQ family toxin [Methylococcales bacterium]
MTSKKTSKNKRTNPPREVTRTKGFHKDWQRLAHSGRYDLNNLKEAMLLLIDNVAPLPAEWLDHSIAGKWANHRECHIGGDFLLIYKIDESGNDERVIFVRTGTHSELFD